MSNVAGHGPSGQGATTRAAIAEAASHLFAEHGYAGTSVRAIAAAVGIDPALVVRYFGSKERLFLETVRLPLPIAKAFDGPLESLGERIVEAMLSGNLPERLATMGALMRASDSDAVREKVREIGELTFIHPLRAQLAGPDADLRARLIGAQMNGLLIALGMDDDRLTHVERARLVAVYGRAVQALVDG
ncbi:TetR family transcriptional regulator [Spongisporangium articulatum]|uniref:TetR family transcriptional regulator n=1 Tax=Spongisporangium articulatum TaxID=3362603 RepID=A0ABW8AGJ5_9ACTN